MRSLGIAVQLIVQVCCLLNCIRDFASKVLQLLDVRVVFKQFPPKFQMKSHALVDRSQKHHEIILKVNDSIYIHTLVIRPAILFYHFLLNLVSIPKDSKLFLHIRLAIPGGREAPQRLELVLKLLVLNMRLQQVQLRALAKPSISLIKHTAHKRVPLLRITLIIIIIRVPIFIFKRHARARLVSAPLHMEAQHSLKKNAVLVLLGVFDKVDELVHVHLQVVLLLKLANRDLQDSAVATLNDAGKRQHDERRA